MHPFGAALADGDIDAAVELISDNIEFRSPVTFEPYRGPAAVAPLLAAVATVLQDFRYTREIGAADGREQALVFRARIGDREIEGCDSLHVDDSGAVDELFVMVRPISGLQALAEAMRAQLDTLETRPVKDPSG